MQNRTGEIVGMAAGFACILVLAFLGELKHVLPTGAAAVVLPVVFFSAVAGVVACALSLRSDALYLSPRIGFRAGLIATLLGSGGIVLAATLAQFGLSTTVHGWGFYRSIGSLLLPRGLIAQACILAALSIPPSLVFGIAGAFLVGFLRLPAPDTSKQPRGTPIPHSAIFKAALVTALLCYLSPFALVLRPKPKPAPIVVAPPPVERSEPTPAPPKWRYEMPAEFPTLDAERIRVIDTRTLPDVSADLPIAVSRDGHLVVHCRSSSRIRVVELETLDVLHEETMPGTPESFAWSTDAKFLLIPVKGDDRWLHVLDLANRRLLRLPKPRMRRVPEGRPEWWSKDEVLFAGATVPPLVLDLDMLRVREAAESPKWKGLSDAEKDQMRTAPSLPVIDRAPWKLGIEARTRSYDVPMNASEVWRTNASLHLALVHSTRAYRAFLPELDLDFNDALLAAGDGTKVIRIRRDQTQVFYLGARPARDLGVRIKMPGPPSAALAELLAKKEVCALICPALINPLNQKKVGPDRDVVKAIARIEEWKDNEALLWIEEEYAPIESGDVVADLHTWRIGKPTEAGDLIASEWFAVIEQLSAEPPLPLRSTAADLDRRLAVVLNASTGPARIDKVLPIAPRSQPEPAAPVSSPSPPPSAPVVRNRAINPDLQRQLMRFLVEHHAKSSRGDIEGLLTDYTENVDYFDKGQVTRDFIRREEVNYRPPGSRTTESITGEVTLEHLGSELFSAKYPLHFRREHADGRITEGVTDVYFKMILAPGGAEIYHQRATLRSRTKKP